MENIFETIRYLEKKAQELGFNIGRLEKSENRNGQHSYYFNLSKKINSGASSVCWSVRVSDHYKNPNFRTEDIWVIGTDYLDLCRALKEMLLRCSERASSLEKKNEETLSFFKNLLKNEEFIKDYKKYNKFCYYNYNSIAKSEKKLAAFAEKYGFDKKLINLAIVSDYLKSETA